MAKRSLEKIESDLKKVITSTKDFDSMITIIAKYIYKYYTFKKK